MALTTSTVLATAAVAGGIASAGAAVMQHQQQKINAKAQESQANYNARLEQQAAKEQEQVTLENARRQEEANAALRASQRVAYGKSGAAMEAGSPLAVLGATAGEQQRQVQNIHQQGYWAAQQHANAAGMYKYQAGVARASRPSAMSLGMNLLGAAASGTSGAVSGYMAGKNYQMQKAQLSK